IPQTQVDGNSAAHFPVVLEIHAVKFDVRVRGGPTDHLRRSVERAQQESGKPAAVVQGVRIVERFGGDGRREEEIRRAGYVGEAIAATLLKTGLEVMRASLLRNLDVGSLARGFLVPVEA